ncbi:MAG: YjeF C-terminal domain-containing protein [Bacteroidetes bacterium]|nr:MAG: YjeF C-terminal domain-containing protein [Bacteroidota bacterium]
MKILSVPQIREADAYTIANEPVASIDLMERAARTCKNRITANCAKDQRFVIVCGNGNNGGDGLAIARMLVAENGSDLRVVIVPVAAKASDDFTTNLERLKTVLAPEKINEIEADAVRTKIVFNPHTDIIVDALFGSGLNRPAEGLAAAVIGEINRSGCPVIAIDIPSGLFGDDNRENTGAAIVHAQETLTFQSPKLAFMFAENAVYTGRVVVLDIGIHPAFLHDVKTPFGFLEEGDLRGLLRPRDKFSHKGTYGHALLVAGSKGKMGAAVLASLSCLRSGAGLVTTMIPKCGYEILQSAVPEAMVIESEEENFIAGKIADEKFSATGIGPGIGTSEETVRSLKILVQQCKTQLVLDADAINILAENKTWLSFLPGNTILTPHPGEFDRLFGKHDSGHARMITQRAMAMKFNLYIVLKGAHTSIACPDGNVLFNSTGNPGMATAGSGDVLTGIITSFCAQGYSAAASCFLGVFLHGRAGDIAAAAGPVIARDIVHALPAAFVSVLQTK